LFNYGKMISNELLLTNTNSEFVRVRFKFVVIYFSIPAAPFGSLIPGARPDLLRPVLWCGGWQALLDRIGGLGDVKIDVMPVSAGAT